MALFLSVRLCKPFYLFLCNFIHLFIKRLSRLPVAFYGRFCDLGNLFYFVLDFWCDLNYTLGVVKIQEVIN